MAVHNDIMASFNMCEANTPMRKTGGAVIGLIKEMREFFVEQPSAKGSNY
jgi:hypothetical protein